VKRRIAVVEDRVVVEVQQRRLVHQPGRRADDGAGGGIDRPRQPRARAEVVLVDGEVLRVPVGRERTRRRHVEHVVADPVQHLQPGGHLPVVLDEQPVEGRLVIRVPVAEQLLQAGIAERVLPAPGRQVARGIRKRVMELLAAHAAIANPLQVEPGLEAVRAAQPADVVDHLSDPLVEVEAHRVGVAEPRAAERRDARDGDRGAVDGDPLRAELVAPRVLHAQLVQHVRADRGHQLRRCRVHAVGEVGRAVRGRQPAADVGGGEVLEQEVAHRELVRRAEADVRLAEREVDLLVRVDDAAGRERDAERRGILGGDGDDLAAGDEAAVHVLVGAVEVDLIAADRAAGRRREVVRFGVGLARAGRQEERPLRERVPLEPEAGGAVEVVGARRRNGVVDHPGRLAELRREAVGDELHLAHEHLRDRQHAKAGAILLGVGVPVELVVGVHLGAVRIDAGHPEFVVLVAGDVGLEEGEVIRIPGHQRQVRDFRLADGATEVDLAGIRDGRLAGDRNRFRDAADGQDHIDDGGLSRREGNPLLFELLEALELCHDGIRSKRQERGAIGPFAAADDRSLGAGAGVGDGDRDTRERGPTAVGDGAFDAAIDRLRLREGRQRRPEHEQGGDHPRGP
jgi:hypothetical protein